MIDTTIEYDCYITDNECQVKVWGFFQPKVTQCRVRGEVWRDGDVNTKNRESFTYPEILENEKMYFHTTDTTENIHVRMYNIRCINTNVGSINFRSN